MIPIMMMMTIMRVMTIMVMIKIKIKMAVNRTIFKLGASDFAR